METFDIKTARKDLYGGKVGVFALVDVPPQNYLMLDGHGNPNTAPEYRVAVEALYTASYAIRLAAKKQLERVHVVGPLEGLWWADDMSAFTARAKDDWNWTMMIHQPEWITSALANTALRNSRARTDASPVHARTRAHLRRQAPRNLPQRPAQNRGCQVEDVAEAAGSHRLVTTGDLMP